MPKRNKTGMERQTPGDNLHMEPTKGKLTGMGEQWYQDVEDTGFDKEKKKKTLKMSVS